MQEAQLRSLDQEDPLEEAMTPHSSILAWETPWAEEPGGPQSMGLQKIQTRLSSYAIPTVLFLGLRIKLRVEERNSILQNK